MSNSVTREGILGLMGQWDPTDIHSGRLRGGLYSFCQRRDAVAGIIVCRKPRRQRDAHQHFRHGRRGLSGASQRRRHARFPRRKRLTDRHNPGFLPKIVTHEAELRAFVQAIADDTPVPVPGEQGLMVTRILDALYQSAETGREVLM